MRRRYPWPQIVGPIVIEPSNYREIDVSAAAWHAATFEAGGSVTQTRAQIDGRLVSRLKSSALWPKLDSLFIFATESEEAALIDVKRLVTATKIGAPKHERNRGFAFLGAHGIDPDYNPKSQPGRQWAQNDASFGCWRYWRGVLNGRHMMGSSEGNDNALYSTSAAGQINGSANGDEAGTQFAHAAARGLYVVRRNGASAVQILHNGEVIGEPNGASAAVEDIGCYIGASRNAGGINLPCDDKLACAFYAEGMSDEDHAELYLALYEYMGAIGVTSGAVYNVDTSAYLSAAENAGATFDDATRGYYDALIVGLIADGVWAKLDRLWLTSVLDQTAANMDLKGRSALTPVNSPTWHRRAGYKPNGTTQYLNLNVNLSTLGGQYAQNSGHATVQCRDNTASSNAVLGVEDGTSSLRIVPRTATDQMQWGINQATPGTGGTSGILTSADFFGISRRASNDIEAYKGPSSLASAGTASNGVPNGNVYAGARNSSGSAAGFSTRAIEAISLGGGLTDAEMLALYTRIQTFRAAIGAHSLEAWAYSNAAVTAGATMAPDTRDAYDVYIKGLIAAGVWTKLDRLWGLAALDAFAANLDLKSLATLTPVNTPTFAAGVGYDFDGSTQYLNLGVNLSTLGGKYGQNDGHAMARVNDNVPSSNPVLGAYDGAQRLYLNPRRATNDAQVAINQPTAGGVGSGVDNSIGCWIATRRASNDNEVYRGATTLAQYTTASGGVPNAVVYAGAQNNNGSAANFTSRGLAAIGLGGGLTDVEAAAYSTLTEAWMATMGDLAA